MLLTIPRTSSRASLLITTVVAVVGAWFGFANPVYQIPPLVLLFPMALAFTALTAPSHASAWKNGWIIGTAVTTSCLYWVVIPVHQYGHLPLLLALPCPFILGSVLGMYSSAYTLCLFHLRSRLSWPLLGLFAGALWASLEMAQGWILTGFPWLVLSSAFSIWPHAIQSVRYIGACGMAGLIAMAALWTVQTCSTPRAAWGIVLALCLGAMPALFPDPDSPRTAPLRTVIVQGNIDQDHKWDPAFQQATVDTYERLSRLHTQSNATSLVVWPETAMPFYFQDDSPLKERVTALVKEKNILLITGAPGYTVIPGSSSPGYKLYNRAFLLTPREKDAAWYDKRHLVPFGEYIPLGTFIPFVRKLVMGAMDFSQGTDSAPLRYNHLALGVLICYEAIFPDLAQEDVGRGANILINISNDTWFGQSSAPRQHLNLSVLRAVEQNRYLIRCTNTGISAFIDNKGHILNTTELFKEQTLIQNTVYPISETSVYHRGYTYIRCFFLLITLSIGLPACLLKDRTAR